MEKEQFRGSNIGQKISHLCFSVPSSLVIKKQAQIHCINNRLYEVNPAVVSKGRVPANYGVLDCRLGTSQKNNKCETCGQDLAECVGHSGYIDLALPVFHVGYFRYITCILQTICKKCSKVLLPPDLRATYSLRLKKPDLSYLEKKALQKDICDKCKKIKSCPFCGAVNGQVKKVGLFKIAHVNNPTAVAAKKSKDISLDDTYHAMLDIASRKDTKEFQELNDALRKLKTELLDPIKVRTLFEEIPDQDLPYLLIKSFRPEDLVITRITVPPACIRPSVVNDLDNSNEDDLTIKLSEIVFLNDAISKHKANGVQMHMMVEDWDFLQVHIALYINSETTGIPFQFRPKKPSRGLVQRLKGKHGRFRGNLSGKRVDFSSRSVISPNPNLRIDEVGVPEHIAKILTYPEKVNPANIEFLRQLIINGAEVHPGANFVEVKNTGARMFLKYGNRPMIAKKLRCGDIVERHLCDGDRVLFNRQPSLHKLSIMCHQAKVHKHRTLQFNECACTPYNADFDGDEMNLHLPQTEEAKAEAAILMGIKNNIITPRNGEPLIAAIQDFITGSYLITHKDTFFEKGKAMQLISYILAGPHQETFIDLPPPCIMKPRALWSGKQIFSLVIKPNKESPNRICLRTKGKNYSGRYEDLCINDAYVVVKDGELLCGAVEKATLGSGSKNNIFYVMLRDLNADAATLAMWRLARVASFYLQNRGFSLGIDDVTPSPGLIREKAKLLDNGYTKVDEYILSLKEGKLDAQPGMTADATMEAMILKELSVIRDHGGKCCVKELGVKNAPLIMAMCGSKGSLINVSQMVACVGQQAIRGARVPDGYGDRSLPHFDHKEKSAKAKGFVENSFYSGLTTTEFFFHTMAGREGLLDTAVKTAETGYMQRRLVKALEDLVSHYDGSVRNSRGDVVQFVYGDDSLDPANMEDNNKPVNFDRLLDRARVLHPCPAEPSMDHDQINSQLADSLLLWPDFVSQEYKLDVVKYMKQFSLEVQLFRKKYAKFDFSGVLNYVNRMTPSQLRWFLEECLDKYLRAKLEPATAVGAICAQSIGEPATQMTLKTFHFAGVASMNITQGVPRIKELINANKTISTPIIHAALLNDTDPDWARSVKMRLEKTTLGEVCEYLEEVVLPDEAFVLIKLYSKNISVLKLEVNADSVVESIMKSLKLSPNNLSIESDSVITVRPQVSSELWQLRENLGKVVIKGVSSIKRAAIRVDVKEGIQSHYLAIEGEGLRSVMATYGVDPRRTCSNNVLEVAQVLGIEAGRSIIIREIMETMQGHGISIDERHLKLLADTMTYRGEVLGITRFGLAKMKESALMLASFERTADHLFDAAYFGQEDAIIGVSESIISGVAMKVGTGFFDLVFDSMDEGYPELHRKPVFDDADFHSDFTYQIDAAHAPHV